MKFIIYLFLCPFIIIGYMLKGLFFLISELKSNSKQSYYDTLLDDDLVKALKRDGKFRRKYKQHLVIITSHGGSCPICKMWENKILIDDIYSGGTMKDGNYVLLSKAIEKGLFHKGCRHGMTTYYPEADDIENYTDEEYKNDIKYINDKIDNILCKKKR